LLANTLTQRAFFTGNTTYRYCYSWSSYELPHTHTPRQRYGIHKLQNQGFINAMQFATFRANTEHTTKLNSHTPA